MCLSRILNHARPPTICLPRRGVRDIFNLRRELRVMVVVLLVQVGETTARLLRKRTQSTCHLCLQLLGAISYPKLLDDVVCAAGDGCTNCRVASYSDTGTTHFTPVGICCL